MGEKEKAVILCPKREKKKALSILVEEGGRLKGTARGGSKREKRASNKGRKK